MKLKLENKFIIYVYVCVYIYICVYIILHVLKEIRIGILSFDEVICRQKLLESVILGCII